MAISDQKKFQNDLTRFTEDRRQALIVFDEVAGLGSTS